MKNSNLFQRIGWLSAMALTVAAVAASCSQDELVNGTGKDNPVIGFGISAARTENDSLRTRAANSEEESPVILLGQKGADTLYLHTLVEDNTTLPSPEQLQTRGVPVNEENFKEKCETFLVNAFTPEGNPYMKNVEVASSGNTSIWSPTDGIHYWPDMSLDFYAYAPLSVFDGDNALGSSLSYGDENGKSISFSYTVPTSSDGTTDAEAQPDIMFAHTTCSQGGTNESGVVPLEFAHALAGVKFVTKDITKATVKTITLKNLHGSGTCVYNSGDGTEGRAGTFTWTYSGEKDKSYSQTFNVQVEDEQTKEQPITDKKPEATFMLIPQALDGVEVEVVLIIGNETYSVSGYLTSPDGDRWEAGKIYTYAISPNSINWVYVFEVTENLTIEHGVTSAPYNVKSYRYRRGTPSEKEAIAWTAKWVKGSETDLKDNQSESVSYDEAVADFVDKGNGNTTEIGENLILKVIEGTMHTTHEGDVKLQTETEKGSPDNPYDLSTEGGRSETTANCYMVDAPGTYKLPLVYGNARKNGQNNGAAYSDNAFVDYKGNKINSPYINNPHDATLVWSDGYYMFENVHLSDDKKYLVFSLNPEFMQQANGVVAVRDENGAIMWSWHIWVTERKSEIETGCHVVDDWKGERTYNLMPYNLGWVDAKQVYYNQRDLEFDFKQDITGTSATLKVKQEGVEYDYKDGGSTYYQWGRKDPLVALKNRDQIESDDYRPHEVGQEGYGYKYEINQVKMEEAIRNPNIYYVKGNRASTAWLSSGFSVKLWNSSATSGVEGLGGTDSEKTIYDPSPVGFKVPVSRAFAVFVDGVYGSPDNYNQIGTLNGYITEYANDYSFNTISEGGRIYRVYSKKDGNGEPIDLIATGQRVDRSGLGPIGGLWAMYGVYYWTCDAIGNEGKESRSLCIRYDNEVTTGYSDHCIVYTIGFHGSQTMARPVRCIKDE